MADEVFQFRRAQVGVDGHDGDAQAIEREPVQEEGWPVLQQQPDAVPVAVARLRVAALHPPDHDGRRVVEEVSRVDAVGDGRLGQHPQEGARAVAGSGGRERGRDGGVGGIGEHLGLAERNRAGECRGGGRARHLPYRHAPPVGGVPDRLAVACALPPVRARVGPG